MSHISRSFVIFLFLCAGLSACATATPLSTTTPFSTETPTPTPLALTATETPTPTPEPTATPEPYNVDVERARQNAIIENAPNNIQEFSYLQSDEYLKSLQDKNAKGELPQISPNAVFIQPGMIDLRFDREPPKIATEYGMDNAIGISPVISYKWQIRENNPWVLVDAGFTPIGTKNVGFFVIKWENLDGSESFWGYFAPSFGQQTITTKEFQDRVNRNGGGYPSFAYFFSEDACIKNMGSASSQTDVSAYCQLLGTNPNSALPKEDLREWNETGILKLDFLPWSHGMPHLYK